MVDTPAGEREREKLLLYNREMELAARARGNIMQSQCPHKKPRGPC